MKKHNFSHWVVGSGYSNKNVNRSVFKTDYSYWIHEQLLPTVKKWFLICHRKFNVKHVNTSSITLRQKRRGISIIWTYEPSITLLGQKVTFWILWKIIIFPIARISTWCKGTSLRKIILHSNIKTCHGHETYRVCFYS